MTGTSKQTHNNTYLVENRKIQSSPGSRGALTMLAKKEPETDMHTSQFEHQGRATHVQNKISHQKPSKHCETEQSLTTRKN